MAGDVAAAPPAAVAQEPKRGGITDRARAERRTAWLLCAPAVIVMLLVTGYPIVYAFILSLQRYDLRFPADKEFVGFSNYIDVLGSHTCWTTLFTTGILRRFSCAPAHCL